MLNIGVVTLMMKHVMHNLVGYDQVRNFYDDKIIVDQEILLKYPNYCRV